MRDGNRVIGTCIPTFADEKGEGRKPRIGKRGSRRRERSPEFGVAMRDHRRTSGRVHRARWRKPREVKAESSRLPRRAKRAPDFRTRRARNDSPGFRMSDHPRKTAAKRPTELVEREGESLEEERVESLPTPEASGANSRLPAIGISHLPKSRRKNPRFGFSSGSSATSAWRSRRTVKVSMSRT